jgi:hypothetical protein
LIDHSLMVRLSRPLDRNSSSSASFRHRHFSTSTHTFTSKTRLDERKIEEFRRHWRSDNSVRFLHVSRYEFIYIFPMLYKSSGSLMMNWWVMRLNKVPFSSKIHIAKSSRWFDFGSSVLYMIVSSGSTVNQLSFFACRSYTMGSQNGTITYMLSCTKTYLCSMCGMRLFARRLP